MKFKATIKGTDEWIIGGSLVRETSTGDYVIFRDGLFWADGNEFQSGTWEYVEKETIEVINQYIWK